MAKLHPLDPLTTLEIELTTKLVRESLDTELYKLYRNFSPAPTSGSTTINKSAIIFNSITLKEPEKSILLPLLDKEASGNVRSSSPTAEAVEIPERRSFVVLVEKGTGYVYQVLVNLTTELVESWERAAAGQQPTLTPDDCFDAERIVKNDPGVVERCKLLGYSDMELVVADPWSVGYSGDEEEFENRRLVQLFMYARQFPEDNHYAHPLDFVTVVDLNLEKVIRIENLPIGDDFSRQRSPKTPTRIPKKSLNYDPKFLGGQDFLRKDVKPIQVLSPEGPSFRVQGNFIEWQKFQFRISFNYREGLVLHDVRYQDGPQGSRPLFYRASISEMVVPYGDPRPPFHRKSAFDVGDYGLGFCANSLLLGCDCLGTIKYFDAILNDHKGQPMVIKNAVCLHEEDAGLLWKHTEYRTGKVNVTRSRVLILSFIVTVVNYEYAFYWTFGQDGTISLQIKASGELSTNVLAEGATPAGHGSIVAGGVNAQFHQHMFAVRIDPMIDGPRNTVSTIDIKPLEGGPGSKENPFGQGFGLVEKILENSLEACTSISGQTGRSWKISSCQMNSVTGQPTAWKLAPGDTTGLMAQEGSKIRDRAGFARHSVWVTPYREDQLFAAGFYVNQSKGGDGLPTWAEEAKDHKLVDEDVVLWHCFGLTHIPRVEDFPIMNVETCGFSLKPHNFFNTNPALDVPPTSKEESHSTLVVDNNEINGKSCGGCH